MVVFVQVFSLAEKESHSQSIRKTAAYIQTEQFNEFCHKLHLQLRNILSWSLGKRMSASSR